jgi:hypothetical protein
MVPLVGGKILSAGPGSENQVNADFSVKIFLTREVGMAGRDALTFGAAGQRSKWKRCPG